VDDLVAQAVAHLTGYQNAAWARRFQVLVDRIRSAESSCPGSDATLPLTCAVSQSLSKLMSYKDEYEVARLFTDGRFARQLSEQFEGDLTLQFHMAPPLVARSVDGKPPRKVVLGGWMLLAMRCLSQGKRLRGSRLDVFGRTQERQLERRLIVEFEQRVEELAANLRADRLPMAIQIAKLPQSIRGYGHVKLASVAVARAREAQLLHRFLPQRYPMPDAAIAQAGSFRGIAVVSH
jgi:indolepyruvate ferredoxin oxidoreductase